MKATKRATKEHNASSTDKHRKIAESGEHRAFCSADVFRTHHEVFAHLKRKPRVVLASSSGWPRSMIKMLLKLAGYDVQVAGTGAELRRLLNGGEPLPDVLVAKPPLPGWQAFHARSLLGANGLPVVLVGADIAAARGSFLRPKDFGPGRLWEAPVEPVAIEDAVICALLVHSERHDPPRCQSSA